MDRWDPIWIQYGINMDPILTDGIQYEFDMGILTNEIQYRFDIDLIWVKNNTLTIKISLILTTPNLMNSLKI